jgi:enoyl-CoA hydratase
MTDLISYTRESQRVNIKLNRSSKKNCLNMEILLGLEILFKNVTSDNSVRVIVLSGGETFSAGADLIEFGGLTSKQIEEEWIPIGHRLFSLMASIPIPIIAKISGHAIGGGMELALACDIRICDQTAKFGFPEVTKGAIPGWGGIERITAVAGTGVGRYLALTGEIISAQQAFRLGLITSQVDSEYLETEVDRVCDLILDNSPIAMGLTKRRFYEVDNPDELSIRLDQQSSQIAKLGGELAEGISAFTEKRKARFN